MKSVFVDTGAFFAQIVADDTHHERATALFHQADAEQWELVTTNAVVYETYGLLLVRSRPARDNALAFLDLVTGDRYRIERVATGDEEAAVALIRKHEDKRYSLVDALSFAVMERLRIEEVIAFDRHFRSYGKIRTL